MSPAPTSMSTYRRVRAGCLVIGVLVWAASAGGLIGEDNFSVILLLGSFASYRMFRRARRTDERQLKLFFLSVGACLALFMCTAALPTLMPELLSGDLPNPNIYDVFAIPAYGLALTSMLIMLRSTAAAYVRTLVDGLLIAAGLLFASWVFVLENVFIASRQGGGDLFFLALYPVFDVVSLTVVLLALVRRSNFGKDILYCAIGAFACLSLGDLTDVADSYSTAIPMWVALCFWTTSILLDLVASFAPAAKSKAPEERITVAAAFMPYVTPAIIAGVGWFHWNEEQRFDAVMVTIAAAAVVMLFIRQALALLDNIRLNQRLATTVADLKKSEALLLERERQLHHAAHHDPLTGLANRRLFYDRLTEAIDQRQKYGAVLVLDLDDFKVLNDTDGHQAGDELLVEVASRLRSATRPDDVVARLGGDEFAVLLAGQDGTAARRVAERISQALLQKSGKLPVISASIGFADLEGAVDEEEALRRADEAMYDCKRQGKSGLRIYALS